MKPVRVAIIDSGVHADHPHVNGVAGGTGIGYPDYVDRLGHGTCITAVIREKAPEAELYVVKIFDRRLSAGIESLVAAIRWASEHRMDFVNLSLGTTNQNHTEALREVIDETIVTGAKVVAAYEDEGQRWLPGTLPGVIPVLLDWQLPREAVTKVELPDGCTAYRASGYPRPIAGLSPERNLKGISFAVANVTGFLAGAAAAANR
jgi:subtilisin family serine protease